MQYYFEERFDLVKFVKIVQDAGMYMILRIGPFVAAEWNFGFIFLEIYLFNKSDEEIWNYFIKKIR